MLKIKCLSVHVRTNKKIRAESGYSAKLRYVVSQRRNALFSHALYGRSPLSQRLKFVCRRLPDGYDTGFGQPLGETIPKCRHSRFIYQAGTRM